MAMLYSAKARSLTTTGVKIRKIRHSRIRIAILLCTNCKQFAFSEADGTVFRHGKSCSDDKNYLKKQYICIVDSVFLIPKSIKRYQMLCFLMNFSANTEFWLYLCVVQNH